MNVVTRITAASDRLAACEDALELAHVTLVDNAVAGGWTEREVAKAMLNRAVAHLALLEGSHMAREAAKAYA
ncbi:MAG: hypothetical protein ACTHJ3_10650 [Pararhizobium sp.]